MFSYFSSFINPLTPAWSDIESRIPSTLREIALSISSGSALDPERVDSLFMTWLRDGHVSYQRRAILNGASVSETIAVSGCGRLLPMSHSVEAASDLAVLQEVWGDIARDAPLLEVECIARPAYYFPNSDPERSPLRFLPTHCPIITDVCAALTLYSGSYISCERQWIASENIAHPFNQEVGFWYGEKCWDHDPIQISKDQLHNSLHFAIWLRSQGQRIRLAVHKWASAQRPDLYFGSALVDLRTCLEGLYIGSSMAKGQGIGFTVASRGSCYLGSDSSDCSSKSALLRSFYKLASSAVHGTTVNETLSVGRDVKEVSNLCRQTILRIFDTDLPPWFCSEPSLGT